MTLIPKGKDIDWRYIWQKQTLYPELAEELLRLAYCTHNFLMDQANGGIVRTISRTQAVWKNFQDYKYTLGETFLSTLVSIEETKMQNVQQNVHISLTQLLMHLWKFSILEQIIG